MATQEESEREVHHHVYGCPCCGPTGRWGAIFWGWALAAVGGVWLLSNLGVITEDWWEVVIPILIIGWGVATLLSARRPRDQA